MLEPEGLIELENDVGREGDLSLEALFFLRTPCNLIANQIHFPQVEMSGHVIIPRDQTIKHTA